MNMSKRQAIHTRAGQMRKWLMKTMDQTIRRMGAKCPFRAEWIVSTLKYAGNGKWWVNYVDCSAECSQSLDIPLECYER